MKKYELVIILSPENTEKEAQDSAAKIKAHLETEGAKISYEDFWGLRELAYPIKKHTSGYYFLYEMEIDGAKIQGFDRDFLINKDIIRHLVVLMETQERQALVDEKEEEKKPARRGAPKKSAPKKSSKLDKVLDDSDLNV
ncbi:MAG: 30S ribosomal protein S6 [Candidatus Gracilibacteria bacterium]|jgi:small subunit ribosomal protein S6|nr:30S ribosomal protein S6 [Candidatus Gracilibacteria bacterium]